jgi:hypothetical protein
MGGGREEGVVCCCQQGRRGEDSISREEQGGGGWLRQLQGIPPDLSAAKYTERSPIGGRTVGVGCS